MAMFKRSRRSVEGALELARDATVRLPARRAELYVRVADGCVLVTREGDPDDHVLGPGDELRMRGPGLSVAWALSPARIVVAEGAAGGENRAARAGEVLAGA